MASSNLTRGLIFAFCAAGMGLSQPTRASIEPSTLEATLNPGQSIDERKCVTIPSLPPKVDVLLSFDLTGSMGGTINQAKANAIALMNTLEASGVDFQFAVVSYIDYPGYYDSCGYAASYGWAETDHAYRLLQGMTGDADVVSAAINSMALGSGDDGPQDYTRIFYESYADAGVGWRPGAKRIHLNFGDDVPHDCNLNEGFDDTWTWTTGGDPGRDEIMGTADDLDLQTVLAGMAAANITLLEAHTGGDWTGGLWAYWTGITGGDVFDTYAADFTVVVVARILAAALAPEVNGLTLAASAGYEDWVTRTPEWYDGLETPAEVTFELTITPPEGTPDGTYVFTISAVDDGGVSYGEQEVTIEVISTVEVPVDIKPTSCPNPINTKSQGVLPVAILGTAEFDVTQVDPGSVYLVNPALPPDVVALPLRWSYEDVATPYEPYLGKLGIYDCNTLGPDGYLDLTLKFDTQAVVPILGVVTDGQAVVLQLRGNLKEEFGGTPIVGEDVVRVLLKTK